jgi:imidazole glycerol-phosphate synthase subunit HisH
MRVLLFDYGSGNLHSLGKALQLQGARVATGTALHDADALVLPGVGAFGAAATLLAPHRAAIQRAAAEGMPVLGICLGMQLLLDGSDEGPGAGLGLVAGRVRRLRASRVPHMGWNTVHPVAGDRLFRDVVNARFYFANGFVAEPAEPGATTATTAHEGDTFAAAVRVGSVVGTQFHPEKSGSPGLRLLRNFLESVP